MKKHRTSVWLTMAAITMTCVCAVSQSKQATESIRKKDGYSRAVEFDDAVRENIREGLRSKLSIVVAAIRHAENGRAGREYGILHPRVKPTYRSQAGWCAATVQKNYDRWVASGSKGSFIEYLGSKYCPVGAENDPTGLNSHWVRNVKSISAKIASSKWPWKHASR